MVLALSLLGIVISVVALLVSLLAWLDKIKSDRDQEDADDVMIEYAILPAQSQGRSVDAGMMKRYVPGFSDNSPIPIDVVNLVEKVREMEREKSVATVERIHSAAPYGLGPALPSPQWAIGEAISMGLVKKRGKAVFLTRKGRILEKAYRHLSRQSPGNLPIDSPDAQR